MADVDGEINLIGRPVNIAARLATSPESKGLLVHETYAHFADTTLGSEHWLHRDKRSEVLIEGKPQDPKFRCFRGPQTFDPRALADSQPYRFKSAVLIAYDLPKFSAGDRAQLRKRFTRLAHVFKKLRQSATVVNGAALLSPGGDGGVLVVPGTAAHDGAAIAARLRELSKKVFSIAPDDHVRWQRELPFSASAMGEPTALVARGDGVVVIGTSPEGTWLIHFDRDGEVIWERKIADIDGWIAVGLPDGFAVAGETTTQSPQGAVTTQHVWRFGNDGTLRSDQTWSERNVGGGLHTIREQMFDIDATSDGGLVLAGYTSRGPGKTNIWIVRLAPDGKLLWERIIGKPAPDPNAAVESR